MTEEQANEVIRLLSAATGGRADRETLDYFDASLRNLNYEIALSTATTGSSIWRFFPSWAEFMEIYRAQRSRMGPRPPKPEEKLPPVARGKKIPDWVRRWVAARFLYARFEKEQDMRPFPEQEGNVDPTAEKMPPDAWVEEGKRIADSEVWAAIAESNLGQAPAPADD